MKSTFKEAVVLINGGASGIGKELAYQLGELGSQIIVADRNGSAAKHVYKELISRGVSANYKKVEMTDASAVKELVDSVLKEYGRIDYVFNSAGIFMGGEFRDTPIEKWEAVAANNINAIMNGTHFAYQVMLKQKHGAIINFGSAAGLHPVPAMGIYGSTKYAIVGLSLALRNEAKDFGVNVSVVCPTVVDTPLYDTAIYNKVTIEKLSKRRQSLQKPDTAARRIIKGVARNRATIHTSFGTKVTSAVYRVAPWLYDGVSRRIIQAYRRNIRDE